MIARTTEITLMKVGGNTFDEGNYTISIVDEAAGEYVKIVEQCDEHHQICVDPTEWPELRAAIDTMINTCKPEAS
jgi:hypothetical protein